MYQHAPQKKTCLHTGYARALIWWVYRQRVVSETFKVEIIALDKRISYPLLLRWGTKCPPNLNNVWGCNRIFLVSIDWLPLEWRWESNLVRLRGPLQLCHLTREDPPYLFIPLSNIVS